MEECRKDVTQATCAVTRVVKGKLTYPSRATSRAKLVRIFGYVMEAEEIIREHEVGPPRWIKVVMAGGENISGWRMTQRRCPSSHTITPYQG
jgi:hypothetical protein